ncbi:MAG: hypothetical protein GY775_19770 [Candidatus Scalindua sp.]|nr:hypothetical protein [Candidatus Scalindua sp.]
MAEGTDRPTGANAYSIYVNRDTDATQVDWSAMAKQLTDGAIAIAEGREKKKQEITDATQKAMDELSKVAGTDNQSLGKLLINGSNYSKETLMANMELMRSGGLDPKDFQLIMQQQKDGYKNLSEFVKGADAKYKEAMERLALGEDGASIASDLEIAWNEGTFGFGDLQNKRIISNPRTGELVLVTMVDDGQGNLVVPNLDERPDLYQNAAYINVRSDFQLDRRSTNELADGIVDNLADVITSEVGAFSAISGGGVVTSIKDFRQLFGQVIKDADGNVVNKLVNDDGQPIGYDEFMSDQVDVITGDKTDLSSMNAAQVLSGVGYKFVQSEAEAKEKGYKKYIIYKNVNGRPQVELTEDQMQDARNIAKRAIESRIDLVIKQTQPDTGEQKQQDTSSTIGNKKIENSRANLYGTVNDLVSGDVNKASSAGTTLANIYNKSRAEGRPEITGKVQRVYVNGKPQFVIPFSDRVMTIEGQFANGDPKTVTDIIREIYDVVNPYADDVTVAEEAFNKKKRKVGTKIGEGDASGTVAFKVIEPIDYNSDVSIDGVPQTPQSYLISKLDDRLGYRIDATGTEIKDAVVTAINSVMSQTMADNFTIDVVADDASNSDSKLKITLTDSSGRPTVKEFTNTNDLMTVDLWSDIQKLMDEAIKKYNANKPL